MIIGFGYQNDLLPYLCWNRIQKTLLPSLIRYNGHSAWPHGEVWLTSSSASRQLKATSELNNIGQEVSYLTFLASLQCEGRKAFELMALQRGGGGVLHYAWMTTFLPPLALTP